jgi:hypothetical protein
MGRLVGTFEVTAAVAGDAMPERGLLGPGAVGVGLYEADAGDGLRRVVAVKTEREMV